jgi:hypothetical protein
VDAWVVRSANSVVRTMLPIAPTTMKGLRTFRRSDSSPVATRAMAFAAQYQLASAFTRCSL